MNVKKSKNRLLAGVAGGLAEYQKVSPLLMRTLWVLCGLFTGGLAVVVYILFAVLMAPPSEFDINDFREQ